MQNLPKKSIFVYIKIVQNYIPLTLAGAAINKKLYVLGGVWRLRNQRGQMFQTALPTAWNDILIFPTR